TRGIIGAQTIRDWNLHHDVVWLENGAPAWDFEGYPLQRGQHEAIIPPETQLEERRIQARKLQTTWGIDNVDARDVKAWLKAYGTQRSTYCIDIRTWEEFQKGHLDEAQWVAGGQLLQQTDRYLVVRNSAILLLDDDGVRSTMVAVWLRRMGWPHIAVASIPADVLALGEKRPMSLSKPGFAEKIDDAKRVQLLASGSLLCDCRSSILYKNHPIQNAAYLNRENLKRDSTNLPRQVILLGDDLEYLDLIAKDLSGFGHDVYWLEEWQHLLVPKAAQKSHRYNYISRPVDTYLEAEHFEQGAVFKRENHAYLDWEIGLIKQIADEPAVDFWKP
ncbi:MAG TPA: rhodanese-like domain-containing protein, partial [Castellaniella sp.]|nr:rhodanese-like domain-containing protein [Castellaniella sp.]